MKSYKLSFTAASLSIPESVKVAEIYLTLQDWDLTRSTILENNLLQSQTFSRSKRTTHELILRLKNLDLNQLNYLTETDLDNQKLLLWFTVCKTYPFIAEFATEVLHQKFLIMEKTISSDDYRSFFFKKVELHSELEKITESTQSKLQSTLFLIMRQSDLLNAKNQIIRVIPSVQLARILQPDHQLAYQIYPAFPQEFENLL